MENDKQKPFTDAVSKFSEKLFHGNKFLSQNPKKNKRRFYKELAWDDLKKRKEFLKEIEKNKRFLTGNTKKDLTKFFTENPGGIIKKKDVRRNKIISFMTPKKFICVITLLGFATYSFIFQYLTQIKPDTRPIADNFSTELVLPNRPDVKKNEDGTILLNPVNNDELMAVESKLEKELESGLQYFEIDDKINNIYKVFNFEVTDPSHGKENIIDVIVGSNNKIYSLQYYDIENDRQNFDGINKENSTRTLTSFINLLKTSAPYAVCEFDKDKEYVGSPYAYVNKDSSSIYKVPVFDKNFTSCSIHEFSEDDFDEDYKEKLSQNNLSTEIPSSFDLVLNAYNDAIKSVKNTTQSNYIDILKNYNIINPDTDYQFKEEETEK